MKVRGQGFSKFRASAKTMMRTQSKSALTGEMSSQPEAATAEDDIGPAPEQLYTPAEAQAYIEEIDSVADSCATLFSKVPLTTRCGALLLAPSVLNNVMLAVMTKSMAMGGEFGSSLEAMTLFTDEVAEQVGQTFPSV